MKQVTIVILALLIFLQPFSKLGIYVSFKINQDCISKTLCVKRNIKNNCCQGKCHLHRQLAEADKEEQKQTPKNTKEKVEELYCKHQVSFDFSKPLVYSELQSFSLYDCNFYSSASLTDIFRPPKIHLI